MDTLSEKVPELLVRQGIYPLKDVIFSVHHVRGSWREKMGIGIGSFCPGKMGFKPVGLGFGHLEWEKNVKKNGNGIWELQSGIGKNELGDGIGTSPSGPSCDVGELVSRNGLQLELEILGARTSKIQ